MVRAQRGFSLEQPPMGPCPAAQDTMGLFDHLKGKKAEAGEGKVRENRQRMKEWYGLPDGAAINCFGHKQLGFLEPGDALLQILEENRAKALYDEFIQEVRVCHNSSNPNSSFRKLVGVKFDMERVVDAYRRYKPEFQKHRIHIYYCEAIFQYKNHTDTKHYNSYVYDEHYYWITYVDETKASNYVPKNYTDAKKKVQRAEDHPDDIPFTDLNYIGGRNAS